IGEWRIGSAADPALQTASRAGNLAYQLITTIGDLGSLLLRQDCIGRRALAATKLRLHGFGEQAILALELLEHCGLSLGEIALEPGDCGIAPDGEQARSPLELRLRHGCFGDVAFR